MHDGCLACAPSTSCARRTWTWNCSWATSIAAGRALPALRVPSLLCCTQLTAHSRAFPSKSSMSSKACGKQAAQASQRSTNAVHGAAVECWFKQHGPMQAVRQVAGVGAAPLRGVVQLCGARVNTALLTRRLMSASCSSALNVSCTTAGCTASTWSGRRTTAGRDTTLHS